MFATITTLSHPARGPAIRERAQTLLITDSAWHSLGPLAQEGHTAAEINRSTRTGQNWLHQSAADAHGRQILVSGTPLRAWENTSMWIRLALAPWWVSWIAMAFLTAAFAGPVWLLLQAPDADAWRPMFLAAIGFGAFMASVATITQRSMRRVMAAAVDGLDRSGRARAITATRRGDIPTDPQVLSAAIRLCTASLGGRVRRSPSGWWAKIMPWIWPALFASIAVLDLAAGEHRKAIGYVGVAAVIAATSWWSTHAGNHTQARLDLMNTAAERTNATVVTDT